MAFNTSRHFFARQWVFLHSFSDYGFQSQINFEKLPNLKKRLQNLKKRPKIKPLRLLRKLCKFYVKLVLKTAELVLKIFEKSADFAVFTTSFT